MRGIEITLLIVILGFVIYIALKPKPVTLKITNIERNEDGSMIVKIGCDNPNHTEIEVNVSDIRVTNGSAIILKKKKMKKITPGKQDDVLITIINDQTNLLYELNDEKIEIDGKKLKSTGLNLV